MESAPARQRQSPSAPNSTENLRVMVVDDNADFRESLLTLLRSDNLTIAGEATSGAEALEIVLHADPDVVLMDVRMPGMDGVEATRRLKALRPGVGVVALTAQEDQDVVRDMLVAGAAGYVLKDSSGQQILNAVRHAAHGGAVISPGVAPTVIDELNEALERERRRARELETAHDELVRRIAHRHELVARLGHELRTPVTVIYGVARTLAAGTVSEAQQGELLARLVSRSSSLVRLVERFETAVDTELTVPIDLATLATDIAEGQPRIFVDAGAVRQPVSLNPILARKILEELTDNALRFSPDESRIEVRISTMQPKASVRIVDHGVGIDPRDFDRIFEPLEQGEAVDARIHQGAGLGLSLARAAARAMDGEITLESTGPDGSTFLWTMPRSGA